MAATCVIRAFSSLENKKCADIGKFHIGARSADNGKNIVLQLRGDKEDKNSCDTGYFACLFPYEAAKLYMELEETLSNNGFDMETFANNWYSRKKNPQSSDKMTEADFAKE